MTEQAKVEQRHRDEIDTLMAWQLDQSYVRFKVVQAPTATEYVRHALTPAGCAVLAAALWESDPEGMAAGQGDE